MKVVIAFIVLGLTSVLADHVYPHHIQCASPTCNPPCRMNFDAKPCPSCECSHTLPAIQCSMPKCDSPCRINFSTKPCPSCECHRQPQVHCSMPKCDPP
ncbi:hypothetical protein AVEN_157931-1, partial [Araneus ventricosus]